MQGQTPDLASDKGPFPGEIGVGPVEPDYNAMASFRLLGDSSREV